MQEWIKFNSKVENRKMKGNFENIGDKGNTEFIYHGNL